MFFYVSSNFNEKKGNKFTTSFCRISVHPSSRLYILVEWAFLTKFSFKYNVAVFCRYRISISIQKIFKLISHVFGLFNWLQYPPPPKTILPFVPEAVHPCLYSFVLFVLCVFFLHKKNEIWITMHAFSSILLAFRLNKNSAFDFIKLEDWNKKTSVFSFPGCLVCYLVDFSS